MHPTRYAEVEMLDHEGRIVDSVRGQDASFEETVTMDHLRKIVGDGHGRVGVSVAAKMGGPYGYSSVSMNVTVSLTCSQDSASMAEAREAALGECLSFIDETMGTSMALLHTLLADHYEERK